MSDELAATLDSPTGDMVGLVTVTGPLTATLTSPTGDMVGLVTVTGTLVGSSSAPTGSMTGALGVAGVLAGTLRSPTGSMAGIATPTGLLAALMSAPTGSMVGDVFIFHGPLSATLGAITSSQEGYALPPIVIPTPPTATRPRTPGGSSRVTGSVYTGSGGTGGYVYSALWGRCGRCGTLMNSRPVAPGRKPKYCPECQQANKDTWRSSRGEG